MTLLLNLHFCHSMGNCSANARTDIHASCFSGIDDRFHCLTSWILKVIVRLELLLFIMAAIWESWMKIGYESFFQWFGQGGYYFYNYLADHRSTLLLNQTLSLKSCTLSFSLLCSVVLAIWGCRMLQSTRSCSLHWVAFSCSTI